MKYLIVFITILGMLVLTNNLAIAYDTDSYCKRVADAVGGSYQIEKTCREQEHEAQKRINSMVVQSRIDNYCQRVGQAVGGSYQIKETCIQQELEAKKSID